jgi:hypothetical protein
LSGTCFQTAIVLVNDKTGRTELANGLVIFNEARRSTGTAQAGAWIHALVSFAGQMWRTAAVVEADFSLSFASRLTDAQRFVVEHLAGFACWATGAGARTDAGASATSLRLGTVGVTTASGRLGVAGAAQLSGHIDRQLVLAGTNGAVIGHATFFIALLAAVAQTRIVASLLVAVASLIDAAVFMLGTAIPIVSVALPRRLNLATLLTLTAADVSAAFVAFRAAASGSV